MMNKAMEKKLRNGEAIDVSIFPKDHTGCFILPDYLDIEDTDLCDKSTEQWIWSVGKLADGRRLAAFDGRFYPSKDGVYECVWLR